MFEADRVLKRDWELQLAFAEMARWLKVFEGSP